MEAPMSTTTLAELIDLGRQHERALIQARTLFATAARLDAEAKARRELRDRLQGGLCLAAVGLRQLVGVLAGMSLVLAHECRSADAEDRYLAAEELLSQAVDQLDEACACESRHRPTASQQLALHGVALAAAERAA
jgi:hypothetical protein